MPRKTKPSVNKKVAGATPGGFEFISSRPGN